MKIFKGSVISVNMQKTAKVAVARIVKHKTYGKRYKSEKNYLVHDPYGVMVGDKVSFTAVKPVSKMKKWAIIKEKEVTKEVSKKQKPKKIKKMTKKVKAAK